MNSALVPAPRREPLCMHQFAIQLAQTQAIGEFGGQVDLVFLGDSITQGWYWHGSWGRVWQPRKALNCGIGGDQTGHLLFRLQHGLLDPIAPRAVVQMIGVNNIWSASPAEIAEGVGACLAEVRRTQPDARLLCLAVLPIAGPVKDRDLIVAALNVHLPAIAAQYHADFLDLRPAFQRDGVVRDELFTDGVHLSGEAYEILTRGVEEWAATGEVAVPTL